MRSKSDTGITTTFKGYAAKLTLRSILLIAVLLFIFSYPAIREQFPVPTLVLNIVCYIFYIITAAYFLRKGLQQNDDETVSISIAVLLGLVVGGVILLS